jgi:hypothetical protein
METVTIDEKIRQIMLSEELPESEKLARLHALIPADSCKIDNLNQATPAQLRQLKDGLGPDFPSTSKTFARIRSLIRSPPKFCKSDEIPSALIFPHHFF